MLRVVVSQFLFRRTLPAGAVLFGGTAGPLAVFFAAIPLIVPITLFLTGSFLVGNIGFRITVPLLPSLESLILPVFEFIAVLGAFLLLPAAEVSVAFLVAAAPLVFAFSTMLVRIPAAPPTGSGTPGFNGEVGRARKDLLAPAIAIVGRMGDRTIVRELADRGDSTCEAGTLRDAVRATGFATCFVRFFGFSTSSFSLSAVDIWSLP